MMVLIEIRWVFQYETYENESTGLSNLEKHIRSQHKARKICLYQCDSCMNEFSDIRNLYKHLRLNHVGNQGFILKS